MNTSPTKQLQQGTVAASATAQFRILWKWQIVL